jgi:hypothetical protein
MRRGGTKNLRTPEILLRLKTWHAGTPADRMVPDHISQIVGYPRRQRDHETPKWVSGGHTKKTWADLLNAKSPADPLWWLLCTRQGSNPQPSDRSHMLREGVTRTELFGERASIGKSQVLGSCQLGVNAQGSVQVFGGPPESNT